MDAMGSRKRLAWIDIAKGIGIILMVVGHTIPFRSWAGHAIFSFHMPLFFILSGWTFRRKKTREVVVSSARTLLVPYCGVFLVRLAMSWFAAGHVDARMIRDAILSFVMASGVTVEAFDIPAVGLIWFLMVLFWARIVMNACEGMFDARRVPQFARFAFWLVLGVVGAVTGGVWHLLLPFSFDLVLVACFFMCVGMQMSRLRVERYFTAWWACLAVVAGWLVCVQNSKLALADRIYVMLPVAFLGAVLGTTMTFFVSFAIDATLCGPVRRVLEWSGRQSMLILCVHAFDRFVEWRPLACFGGLPWMEARASSAVVRVLADLAIAYAAYACLSRFKCRAPGRSGSTEQQHRPSKNGHA